MSAEADIVIIGAGAAGIGAARGLAGAGLKVVVLEALPRLGGRAWTQTVAGMKIDLGCEWLHSADRNPWTGIADTLGHEVRRRPTAWDSQYRDLGFPPTEREAAQAAFARWTARIHEPPPPSDCAADLLAPEDARWTPYLQALSGFISGAFLDRISVRDYAAYDAAATDLNWRLPGGYGSLIAAYMPSGCDLRLGLPVQEVALEGHGLALITAQGTLRVRAAIVTVSSDVLAGDAIRWPGALDPWRAAAADLPLGRDEKLFLEVLDDEAFVPDSHLLGDPFDATTANFNIRDFGLPVIECFLGAEGARARTEEGAEAAFARAIDQLAGLMGSGVRRKVRPLAASDWAGTAWIGGGYSHALPGRSEARATLARPFEARLFFAGEATHRTDFSTAHGAYLSGLRAADEARAALGAAR